MENTGSILIGSLKKRRECYKYPKVETLDLEFFLEFFEKALLLLGWTILGLVSSIGIFDGTWVLIPYALAWTLGINCNMPKARSLMVGALIGLFFLTSSVISCFVFLAIILFGEIVIAFSKVKARKKAIWIASLLYPFVIILGRRLAFPIVTFISYTMLCKVVLTLFLHTANTLKERSRRWDAEEFLGVLIAGVIIVTGFLNLNIGGVSLERVIIWQSVICSGFLAGPTWGVVAGVLGSLTNFDHSLACLLIISGSLAGLLSIINKKCFFFIGFLGVGMFMLKSSMFTYGIEITIASLLLPLYLRQLQAIKFSIPTSLPQEQTETRALELRTRINGFANILGELSKVFSRLPVEETDDEKRKLASLVEGIAVRVCQNCSQQESCWHRRFLQTYGNLSELLVSVEDDLDIDNMISKSQRWCIQPKEIVETASSFWEMRGLDIIWQKRLIESKSVVANQLKGLSSVVSDLGCQLDLIKRDKQWTDIVGFELKRCNISFDSLECSCFEYGTAVRIGLKKKHNHCSEKYIRNILSKVIGQKYRVEYHHCQSEYCELYLVPEYLYDVEVYVKRRPAEGYAICGDSFGLATLSRGRHLIALSDGMGIGPEAGLQSSTVVSFIEKFVSLDVSSCEALKLVNSISFLSVEKETFATVDLAIINKYSGELSVSKLGSAPSYLKRGKRVISLSSDTVPVGMLCGLDVSERLIQLYHGDIFVIVSDGVINEGSRKMKDPDWLNNLLKQSNGSGKEIGERIFHTLPENNADDITVIVVELKLV